MCFFNAANEIDTIASPSYSSVRSVQFNKSSQRVNFTPMTEIFNLLSFAVGMVFEPAEETNHFIRFHLLRLLQPPAGSQALDSVVSDFLFEFCFFNMFLVISRALASTICFRIC
jgi:hypothetical protein